ncbi:poly-beta-1,6-N-acetyl-D-glucosamine biosynthesis protein PgaD [Mesobacillus selenatarsenatis]|uniref:Poly-beta-1,6-N-acetyl-D-glucosamine biosynthesis protein PgaD n=1 Tax=Mesobacillus selenatarsenatis (strain DSM 18680 / JCM 14380 / FERM P-15431 / SF-1) TaxID=1321606 RepID=A0A0A8XDQ4_MESS1|nr:poly-beta-1,6-N-acetyl-D-glucosamine biosynthesis protein PgaD [Mesobacillus selenatarsenatis]GAM16286.1 hypothetical protein SAMD00020551_4474 [Mesobacillus selenatarsenatis SF-1]
MIINSKQSNPRKIIDILLTFFGWMFLALFLYNFITHFNVTVDFTFLELNLANANSILLITVFLVITSAAFLSWWSSYNRRKYGPLKRRTFPRATSEKELGELFELTEGEVREIQYYKYYERN